jgi:hypothetical protein
LKSIKPIRSLAAMLAIAVLCAVGASCLPNDPYQKFQLLDGTIYENLRWVYERIHFDRRPVDVVVLGPSTAALGLSSPRMESVLAGDRKPALVANFAIIADGRNVEWAELDELYKAKTPRVIVVAVDGETHRWGHPAFKYIAPATSLVTPPALPSHNFVYDASYLPYRQLELFGALLFPNAFGLDRQFDAARYASFPIDLTVTHGMPDGQWINMDRALPLSELLVQRKKYARQLARDTTPAPIAQVLNADDHGYIREIHRLAAAHGTKIVFVYIPTFDGPDSPQDAAFYRQYGDLLIPPGIAQTSEYYEGALHLNHAGAMALSDQVARAVEPFL